MILTTISILAGLLGVGLGLKKWLTTEVSSVTDAASTSMSGTGRTDTEFSAEVVRVTRIEKHPNADRLEIVRFE